MILQAAQHLFAHLALLHASRWDWALHAAFGGALASPARSDTSAPDRTLLVHFDDGAQGLHGVPPDARRASPEAALQTLRQGRASAAVLVSSRDLHAVLDWLAQLRGAPERSAPAVLLLLPSLAAADRLAALRAGADAVLLWQDPAALIVAQIERLRPRAASAASNWLEGPGGLRLDGTTQRAWVGEQPLSLKPGLFRLLWCLVAEPDRVFSLSALRAATEVEAPTRADSIHAYVSRLRKALRPHRIDACIQTVHRFGYRCVPVLGSAAVVAGAARIDA